MNNRTEFRLLITGVIAGCLLTPLNLSAEGNNTEGFSTGTRETSARIDSILVQTKANQPGQSTLDENELSIFPNTTRSITGALKSLPEIRFSNEENSSLTGGEIRPPQISINGAKPYENNFLIDNIDNTNRLNPSGLGAEDNNAGASFYDLSIHGAEQNMFYDISLIESVTAYTSNIPAKYGGFTGGLISAELRDPRTDRWGISISGKHTKDEWYYMRDVDVDSETPENQPDFSIYSVNVVAEGLLTENTSLMTGYSRLHSNIPLRRCKRTGFREYAYYDDTQHRTNENYFTKLVTNPSENINLSFNFTYAPYEELRWREAWADSDWEIYNDAYRVSANADFMTKAGAITFNAAYSQNGYSRDTATSYRYSRSSLVSEEGEQYGGVGDVTLDNQSIDLKLLFTSIDLDLPWLKRISTGLDFNATKTDMWNEEAESEVFVELPGRIIHTKTVFQEYDQTESLETFGYHLEGDLEWGRAVFTPGMRIDYDSFTENIDVAPRLKAEYDTFNNGTLMLVTGYNRYYGRTLRAYAFKIYRPYLNNQWWIDTSTGDSTHRIIDKVGPDRSYLAKGLDTPYSDEIMAGFYGTSGNVSYRFEAVHRDHRKQLINKVEKIDSDYIYSMTNEGEGSFDGISANVAFTFDSGPLGKQTLTLGASKSWSETFYGGYSDNVYTTSYGIERDYFAVFYDGKLIPRSEMPPDNYNAPLVLSLVLQGNYLDDRLRVASINRWRDDAKGLIKDARISSETPYGTTSNSETRESSAWLNASGAYYHDAYIVGDIRGGFISDLSMELDVLRSSASTATVLFDVTNLFNASLGTSARSSVPVKGRGFYLGMRLDF